MALAYFCLSPGISLGTPKLPPHRTTTHHTTTHHTTPHHTTMKTSFALGVLSALVPAVNAVMCNLTAEAAMMQDASVLQFANCAQTLLTNYYMASNISAMNFSTTAYPFSIVRDLAGLQKQAELGALAVQQTMMLMPNAPMMTMNTSNCMFNFSMPMNGSQVLMDAFKIEAEMCATFIGLADYVLSPTVAFTMARLAAEHGIHAASIQALYMKEAVFMVNSTSLTPAITPMEAMSVLRPMMGTCGSMMTAPQLPCNNTLMNSTLMIGPLIAKVDMKMLETMITP